MSLPVIFRRVAKREYDDAYDYYATQRLRAAKKFARTVTGVLGDISADPLRFPIADLDIREAAVRGFPYCVYYIVEPDRIDILSVFHTSRDPQVWQGRR